MSVVLSSSSSDITKHLLVNAGFGTLGPNTPWPIYSKRQVDAVDNAIFILETAGRDFGRSMIDGEQLEHYGFQLTVRSSTSAVGNLKIRQIDNHLLEGVYDVAVSVGGVTYLVHSYSRVGQVLPLGEEQGTRRELHVANYLTTIRVVN